MTRQNVIIERDIESTEKIFIPTALKNNLIDEEGRKTMEALHTSLTKLRKLEDSAWEREYRCRLQRKIIYLRTPPEECYARIARRGQAGDQYITMQYISQLHEAHEEWLGGRGDEIITLNGEEDQETIVKKLIMETMSKKA